jgi:hypothetical protein
MINLIQPFATSRLLFRAVSMFLLGFLMACTPKADSRKFSDEDFGKRADEWIQKMTLEEKGVATYP